MILVTTYINPDLDGFSAALVYAELLNKTGKPATAGFFGEYQPEVKFVAQKFGINLSAPLENPEAFNQIILVDVSDLSRLDKRLDSKKVIEIIDHRRVNDLAVFPNAKFQIEDIGASATLVAERFRKENTAISKDLAVLLCLAIASHTLNFHADDVTQRDKDVFIWLNQKCDFSQQFIKEIFLAKSDLSSAKLGLQMEGDLKTFDCGGKKITIVLLETVDGEILARERGQEIISKLAELKEKLKPDFIFLSIIDLEKLIDFFVSKELEVQDLLKAVLGVEFKDSIAKTEKLIRRKGLVLLLQEWLENNSPKG
jgi:manganese-dependent inorganic pyrophosphatase